MSSTTSRWSRESGRPRPQRSPIVAPDETRRTRLGVDAALAHGAVEHALARIKAALRRQGIAATLLADPVNLRYASGTSLMPGIRYWLK